MWLPLYRKYEQSLPWLSDGTSTRHKPRSRQLNNLAQIVYFLLVRLHLLSTRALRANIGPFSHVSLSIQYWVLTLTLYACGLHVSATLSRLSFRSNYVKLMIFLTIGWQITRGIYSTQYAEPVKGEKKFSSKNGKNQLFVKSKKGKKRKKWGEKWGNKEKRRGKIMVKKGKTGERRDTI